MDSGLSSGDAEPTAALQEGPRPSLCASLAKSSRAGQSRETGQGGVAACPGQVTSEQPPTPSPAGPKMVAVQNYHGNPAPPGKPVLTFQTGDVIELLRGDPESPWWEVGPGPGPGSSAPRVAAGSRGGGWREGLCRCPGASSWGIASHGGEAVPLRGRPSCWCPWPPFLPAGPLVLPRLCPGATRPPPRPALARPAALCAVWGDQARARPCPPPHPGSPLGKGSTRARERPVTWLQP